MLHGRLGKVVGGTARVYNSRAQAFAILKRDPHATPVLDVLTYYVDLMCWFLEGNRPVEVVARGQHGIFKEAGYGAHDVTWAIVTFADGAVINLGVSYALPARYPTLGQSDRVELLGTEGTMIIDDDHMDHLLFSEKGIPHAYVPDHTRSTWRSSAAIRRATGRWAISGGRSATRRAPGSITWRPARRPSTPRPSRRASTWRPPSPSSARWRPARAVRRATPSSPRTRASSASARRLRRAVEACDVVIDADGTTAIPGLIDSHVHVTFGDYTPRQRTVGYLESYLHGGVTTAISASEVHVPGRPRDADGVKALAVAAHKCFAQYRPGGMRVHAGSVILEPTLSGNDLGEIAKQGVWLAKAGFGAFDSAYDYAPLIAAARAHRMITTVHTGGSSIPGSARSPATICWRCSPHVSFHVNGGPTAMPDRDFERVIVESDIALQVCTAGNLRTTLLCARLAERHRAFDRFIIATDTPTGSGIMPLGMLYTIAHLASLGGIAPERAIAAATGSNARVYRLDTGLLAAGKAADIVLIDAPDGGTQTTALAAIQNGDIAAVGAVITAGVPRFVGRSRNTPATTRRAHESKNCRARPGYAFSQALGLVDRPSPPGAVSALDQCPPSFRLLRVRRDARGL